MSRIKINVKNRKTGKETIFGDEYLPVVFPYGLGPTTSTVDEELNKINIAEKFNADMVKDNTIGRKEWLELIRRVREKTDLCVAGSATITAANMVFCREDQPRANPTEQDFYKAFETLSQYCDAIEVFPTITLEGIEKINHSDRLMKNSISRAGDIISRYMHEEKKENPFFSDFDWFLDESKKNDVTLILGNGYRPGCLHDSLDVLQMYEIDLMRQFADKAVKKGVGIVAGIYGHTKYDLNTLKAIRETIEIPIGGLGPLLTDIGIGYDHLNAAIGTVMLREYIDWVSLITPAEHTSLPSLRDCQDGMTAINLARHILDLMKGKGYERDLKLSEARGKLDWESMREQSINPYSVKWEEIGVRQKSPCTLCGAWCPLLYKNNSEKNKGT